MSAGKYHFIIEQGAQIRKVFTFSGQDFTGYTARMKIKSLNGTTVLSLTSSPSSGDRLVLSGDTVTVIITSATTTAMKFSQGMYDLELVDGSGEVDRRIEGIVALSTQVTD